MKINVNDNNRETVHTIIAATLIVSGMLAFFLDLCAVGNVGEVGTGTLAYIGEAFTLAGALLGIVQYVNGRFVAFESKIRKKTDDTEK